MCSKGTFFGNPKCIGNLTFVEENTVTRPEAGLLLVALHLFLFLCVLGLGEPVLLEINDSQIYLQTMELNLQRCDIKLEALKKFLVKNREKLVNDVELTMPKVCDDLRIVMERWHWNKKMKHIFGDGSQDTELPYDIELRKEMFSSLDRVIQEINLGFQQLYELAPTYLIDDQYKC